MEQEALGAVNFKANVRVLGQAYKWAIPVLLFFPIVSQFLKPSLSWGSLLISYAVVAVLCGGIWWDLKHTVILAIAPEGLHGLGGTKRKLTFSWADEITLKEMMVNGAQYLQLSPLKGRSFLPISSASQIHIPEHIYSSHEFVVTVKKHSPAWHPLRLWLLNQPNTATQS